MKVADNWPVGTLVWLADDGTGGFKTTRAKQHGRMWLVTEYTKRKIGSDEIALKSLATGGVIVFEKTKHITRAEQEQTSC